MAPGLIKRNISDHGTLVQEEGGGTALIVRASDIVIVICYTPVLTSGPAASAGDREAADARCRTLQLDTTRLAKAADPQRWR